MQSVSMLTRPSAQRQIRIGTRQAPATSVSTHYLTLTPARASTSLLHSSNSSNPQTATASANPGSEEERFHKAFAAAFTMSQLYVKNRPEAVPLSEWEARRKKRDMEDIMQAAKRRSKDPEKVKANLEQLETVLPNLIDLNKMKAADWVQLSEDVQGAANKLIILKSEFPTADVFSIMATRPKTLLQSEQQIEENAKQVKALLSRADNIDTIIQSVPELSDPATLSRSLGYLASYFPGQDPVALLQENPTILLNLGESNIEDSAEYGEMTTKD
eukprot:GHUV01002584.1.p1 GENE.GHUV01002584.1~~GHUV01002584.1.p1  ORF type:complete len:273 (+),score=66.45 GHUV01002584.1:493-1311(+)